MTIRPHITTRKARSAERATTEQLARELAAFESQADLGELSAVLRRHDDAAAEPLRRLVDWTRAA